MTPEQIVASAREEYIDATKAFLANASFANTSRQAFAEMRWKALCDRFADAIPDELKQAIIKNPRKYDP